MSRGVLGCGYRGAAEPESDCLLLGEVRGKRRGEKKGNVVERGQQ